MKAHVLYIKVSRRLRLQIIIKKIYILQQIFMLMTFIQCHIVNVQSSYLRLICLPHKTNRFTYYMMIYSNNKNLAKFSIFIRLQFIIFSVSFLIIYLCLMFLFFLIITESQIWKKNMYFCFVIVQPII